MESKFYTIDQVAEILDIHHKTIRKFIKEGKLKANKFGKQWRISQEDLDAFTKAQNPVVINKDADYEEEIEVLNNHSETEIINSIKVSSVVDLENINEESYLRISNMLLAMMNCKDNRIQGHNINMKYSKNTNRLRIMIWADIDETKELLDVISMLVEDKNKGEGNNEV